MTHHLYSEDIHIWKVETRNHDVLEECMSVLSEKELQKINYFKFDNVKNQYIINQGMLRLLLSNYLDINPKKVRIGKHPKGKPYSLDNSSLFFNSSNSHGLCVFAFSRDSEIGIDIEKKRELMDFQDLINKNFTAFEKKFITSNPNEKLERFFRFWTIKEAYLKAIGEGMRLTPENIEFSIERNKVKFLSRKGIFELEDWIFKEFNPCNNFVGTIVYQKESCNFTEKWYDDFNKN